MAPGCSHARCDISIITGVLGQDVYDLSLDERGLQVRSPERVAIGVGICPETGVRSWFRAKVEENGDFN